MSKSLSKEFLNVNRICKEVRWLTYDPDYKHIDLKKALEILEELKASLEKQINEGR